MQHYLLLLKKLFPLANNFNKPVNLATNVFDSMMQTSMPSRAEISDIYNNLSLGVSGIVLAAEVAIGNNPVSSTALLNYIIDLYRHHIKKSMDLVQLINPQEI